LRSFEAVFSPLDAQGLPRKLYDRSTGIIDLETAKAWQPYDIRLKLERNWSELGPKLAGKLHITMGEEDTFFLEGATRKLAEALQALGSDAEITMVPGANHMNLVTDDIRQRRREQMTAAFLKHHPQSN
jgi:S-formylglutathione hydrolase FrmB